MQSIIDKPLSKFDYFYMFVIVIYMGQATPETSRMVGDLSGNPIPLLIPMILTFILWMKHRVPLANKKFLAVMGLYCVWAIMSLIKYGIYTTGELSYHFFMIYAIVVAYIQDAIYGPKLLSLYERIIVWFCKVTTMLWLISVLIPASSAIFSLFPKTYIGSNVLYIFEWNSDTLRNSGCAWEPGRYAVMVALGIYCNLCQNGIKFHRNSNIWWLLISLASTMSTTGYCTVIVVYSLYYFRKFTLKNIVVYAFVVAPIVMGLFQLDFMQEKINSKIDNAQNIERWKDNFAWNKENHSKDKYLGSIDRFEAMAFETMDIQADPILGYSRNFDHSYFHTKMSSQYVLAHGLLKVFGMYGIFMGLYFYYILYKSSVQISKNSTIHQPLGLFILFCLSSISYQILSVPIFTAFWFYGIFNRNNRSLLS